MELILQEDYIKAYMHMPIGTLSSVKEECAFLKEEVEALEKWSWMFYQPVILGAEVTKHWVFKKDEIKQSAATSGQLWDEGKPYSAGKESANTMILGIGPLSDYYVPFTPMPASDS